MKDYIEEVDDNFSTFFDEVEHSVKSVLEENNKNKSKFKESYRRLVSFQAWNSEIISTIATQRSVDFFREAQNDALTSHALARQGAWRVALMSLRSCVENTLFGLYYVDHPVELKLWELGKHRLGFTEVVNYLSKHPQFIGFSEQFTGIEILKTEYATLSQAVHGSSKLFRVTKEGEIQGLNIVSPVDLGKWQAREQMTVISLNMILLTFFKEDLTGASNLNLRKALSLVIPEKNFGRIKKEYKVNLRKANQ